MKLSSQFFPASILCLFAVSSSLVADEDKKDGAPAAAIHLLTNNGNVFGDQEAEVRFRIDVSRAVKGRVIWRYSVGTATVGAREIELAAAPDTPANIVVKLPIPSVKDGIILQSQLAISVVEAGQNTPLASVSRNIWVFPKDPFSDRSDWLKKLKISLYDPAGQTKKTLTAAKVPFEEINNAAALSDLKEGFLLIGEGVSFKEERDLSSVLGPLVRRGMVVLCLAPADGEIPVPGLSDSSEGLRNLTFQRDVVHRLDKRLATDGWPAVNMAVASFFAVKNGGNGIAAEATKDANGWTWIETRAESGSGRFAVCGQAMIAKWENGPTARFLLAKLFDHLTEADSEKGD